MSRPRASRTVENAIRRLGYVHVAGVDEVGRGCLAGPVVAAAVVLDPDRYVPGVARLQGPDARPCASACSPRSSPPRWPGSVAVIEADEIDRINIHRASLRGDARTP